MESAPVLVYAGNGSSHSWTWLADLFESKGIFGVRFVDSKTFTESLNYGVSCAIVSGGDVFRIASSIGDHGFAHLKGFIHQGGTYVGICAGAYLPLPSSIEPFNKFNLSTTRIENIERGAGMPQDVSPRIAVRYGSCSIVHPVRGELEIDFGTETIFAPLYGGPVFKEPTVDTVVCRYRGLTQTTEVQMDRETAERMLKGRPAAIRSKHGSGQLLLLGPHLEHPGFTRANELFLSLLPQLPRTDRKLVSDEKRIRNLSLGRSIADLKVAIVGLENRSFLVGSKLWDGGRFMELVLAIEKRRGSLGPELSKSISEKLVLIKEQILAGNESILREASKSSELLVSAARECVDGHFLAMNRKG
ncbi:MAG: BPL-N domain-containing protein [Thermoplasmata archaeon]